MKLTDIIFAGISVLIMTIFFILSYMETNKELKFKMSFKNLILLLIFSLAIIFNNTYFNNLLRMANAIILLFSLYYIIFKEDFQTCLIKTILVHLSFLLVETLLLLFAVLIAPSWTDYNKLYILKSVLTFLNSFLVVYGFKKTKIYKIFNFFDKHNKLKNNITLILLLLIISTFIISFVSVTKFDISTAIFSVILITIFIYYSLMLIVEFNNVKKAEKKEEVLLKFISKYEKLLDSNRINRHEMLNNLLILKSYNNKNTKSYEDILDNLIETYQTKESRNVSSLYNLPSGLKGIIYYKINSIEENDINFILNVSPKVEKRLLKINTDLYYNICKIVGILLDNAIEASKVSKEKTITVDIYIEKENINIYVENSCDKIVDINKIKNKGFTTKGRNHGYGLYIVDGIINKNDQISLEQNFEDSKFISLLRIKTKK